jgi:hypothetical protein
LAWVLWHIYILKMFITKSYTDELQVDQGSPVDEPRVILGRPGQDVIVQGSSEEEVVIQGTQLNYTADRNRQAMKFEESYLVVLLEKHCNHT